MRNVLAALAVGLAATAGAEEPAPVAPAPVEAAPASYTPQAPPPREVLAAFQERYLSVDPETGAATRGKAHQPLAPEAFYAELGRPDLVERLDRTRHTKIALYLAGGAVAAVGVAAGIYEFSTKPNLNAGDCTQTAIFNSRCQPEAERKELLGAVFLAGGAAGGALLALLGYKLDPAPVSPFEARSLANARNAQLWKELRGEPRPVSVAPLLGPHGAGLGVLARF